MKRLDQRVAVVTGGSRGLGKGIVSELAAEGAQVWAVARNGEKLAKLKAEIGGVQTLEIDVSEPGAASRVFDSVTPDILVLNAGAAPHMAPFRSKPGNSSGCPGPPMLDPRSILATPHCWLHCPPEVRSLPLAAVQR